MEQTFLTYKDKLFTELKEEYESEIFIISDFEYIVNGCLVTHIALNENGDACVIAGTDNGEIEFWDYNYEQLALTKEQWEELIELLENLM